MHNAMRKGEVTLKNTPMNRGMLAVTKHLRDVHPRPASDETPRETMALCNRIMELGQFSKCQTQKDRGRSGKSCATIQVFTGLAASRSSNYRLQ